MDEELIAAIAAKDLRRVEELLAAGANPNARKGDKTAYQLVPHGANEIKCALIEAGAEDPELRHSLVWVINTGRVEAVRVLIEKGADLNVKTGLGTPLQAAACGGHTEIAELLIAAGADPDAGNLKGPPLLEALEAGHTDIALKLIGADANPNLTADFGSVPPVAIAVAQGFPDVLRALIAAGADVNVPVRHITLNQQQVTQELLLEVRDKVSKIQAAWEIIKSAEGLDEEDAQFKVRAMELESKTDQIKSAAAEEKTRRRTEPVNAVDTYPVIIAARCDRAEALAVLLEAGAEPHRKDGEGMSAYDWAVRNKHSNVLAVLQQFGITETRFDVSEKLLLAAESGDVSAVRECLSQGANANARDSRSKTRDKTPLILASMAGHSTVVGVLLEAGADPNMTDRGPEAKPVSKSLLEHTDPDTIAGMGYSLGGTALMSAAIAGHTEIVRQLLQAGADPNFKDDVEYAALALAAENRRLGAVRELVAAGAEGASHFCNE